MAGLGFALLVPLLWKGDVAAGRLCVPFPDRISTRSWAYWLVYPRERRMVPKVKRFREWLVVEMQRAVEELDGGWASQDRVMPPEHGRRLAALLPQGQLTEIDDSYTLVPLDQPERLAQAIREFVGAPQPTAP